MSVLPIEQVTQRHHRGVVQAPGVTLWMSETSDYDLVEWEATVLTVDAVEDDDVELAQMAPPSFFWNVETSGEAYPDRPGVYQNFEFGDFAFGDGSFGGEETIWYQDRPQYGYDLSRDDY